MPYSLLEMNAANKAPAIAARAAARNGRAAVLRARWLKLGGEPADWDAAEATLLRRDLEERLLDPASRHLDQTLDRETPETSLT